jgi:hypothetical protein
MLLIERIGEVLYSPDLFAQVIRPDDLCEIPGCDFPPGGRGLVIDHATEYRCAI